MNSRKRLISLLLSAAVMMSACAATAVSASAALQPPAAAQSTAVRLDKTAMSLGRGESYRINPTSGSDLIWSSSDPSVATVNGGLVSGKKNGIAVITAKGAGGQSAKCTVTVKDPPSSVTITKGVLTLGVGESFTLGSGVNNGAASANRTYRTSNSSIVKMTNTKWTGKFTALKPGVAYVTVRTYNGKESACKVTVKPAPTSVTLTRGDLVLAVGEKYTLGSGLNQGAAAATRTYRTSNSSVVKMTRTDWVGEFTAVAPGVAYVTVRTYNRKERSCKVTVKYQPTSLGLKYNLIDLDPGKSEKIIPQFPYGQGTENITYTVVDGSVASVDKNGNVKAKKAGTTDVIVKTGNGISEKAEIIVYGDKTRSLFPELSQTEKLLNSVKLNPMKTNCTEIDKLVDGIFAKIIKGGMTPAQKVQACYDYLVKNSTYVPPIEYHMDISGYLYKYPEDSNAVSGAYPILKYKLGVCYNYSAAFAVMMRRLGYEANLAEGLVAASGGGYTGHTWVDVTLNGKHYTFDPQVEDDSNKEPEAIQYFYFGMKAEENYNMYHYGRIIHIHNFKVEKKTGVLYHKTRLTATSGKQEIRCTSKIPEGKTYNFVFVAQNTDNEQSDLTIKLTDTVNIKIEMYDNVYPYSVKLNVIKESPELNGEEDYLGYSFIADKVCNKDCCFSWKPTNGKGFYRLQAEITYETFDLMLLKDYTTKYDFWVVVE